MHVLYITKTMPFGAQEAFIFPEIEEHLRAGWDVTIAPVQRAELIHKGSDLLLARTLAYGLFAPRMAAPFLRTLVRHPRRMAGAIATVLRVPLSLKLKNCAVVIKAAWLAQEAQRRGVDHIHVHWIAVPATMGLIASRLSGIPLSITCHRYDIDQNNCIAEKFAASSFVRAIDTAGASELIARIPATEKRPLLIRMGAEVPDQVIALRPGALERVETIIGARFVEKKGHATFIRAVAAARAQGVEVAVDAYGDGPLETRLQQLAAELQVADLFRFRGVTSHKGLLDHIRSGRYDIAVLPSVTAADGDKEGIPVFLMEAMAAGLPVISTPNGGICELIAADCGLLVPEFEVAALAEALIAMAKNGALRQNCAINGRIVIEDQFSAKSCAAALRRQIEYS